MKSIWTIPHAVLLFASAIIAGNLGNLQFGGYLENRTTLTVADNEIISDVAQARLEGTWEYGDRGGVETHVIFSAALQPLDPFENIREGSVMERAVWGLLGLNMGMLQDYQRVADSILQEAGREPTSVFTSEIERLMTYLPYSTFYPDDKVLLDRALIKIYFKPFDLYVGRQMIAWGTGYAFNPTDVWNTKNPLDPDAPKVGVNALRVEIPFGAVSGLSLVASPGHDFKHASGGFRYKTNIGRFDISACGMRIMTADRELLGLPKKIMAGADMAGQIWEIGVWAEAAVNNPVYSGMEYTDFDSSFVQAAVGCDYTFENGLYAMVEYYYNGLGQDDPDEYGATELINLFTGEMSGFAQHYLFAGARFDIAGIINVGLFGLGNLNDRSAMLIPTVGYDPTDNITIELGGQIGVGDHEETEYGSVYPNVMLTVTGYF